MVRFVLSVFAALLLGGCIAVPVPIPSAQGPCGPLAGLMSDPDRGVRAILQTPAGRSLRPATPEEIACARANGLPDTTI